MVSLHLWILKIHTPIVQYLAILPSHLGGNIFVLIRHKGWYFFDAFCSTVHVHYRYGGTDLDSPEELKRWKEILGKLNDRVRYDRREFKKRHWHMHLNSCRSRSLSHWVNFTVVMRIFPRVVLIVRFCKLSSFVVMICRYNCSSPAVLTR